MQKRNIFVLAMFFMLFFTRCGRFSGTSAVNLSGMGNSFAQPFYHLIFSNYSRDTGIEITYSDPCNSNGIRSFRDKTVDFVISNALLTPKELAEFHSEVLQIPVVLGAISLAYNIPNVKQLNLTSVILAAIYTSQITYWDDEAIVAVNSGVSLPHLAITPVYRSDEAGSTQTFSLFLSQDNAWWEKQMGISKQLNFSKGLAAQSSLAVASLVENTQGAIGYISLEYATSFKLPVAAVQNSSGAFIQPNPDTILNATIDDGSTNLLTTLIRSEQTNAYPICCYSWIIVYRNQAYGGRDEAKYESMKSLLNYLIGEEAQKTAKLLIYTPLPQKVVEQAKQLIHTMEWQS
ncbi:MAG: phosphate ABC transporter substrate-binding protein PstS [Dysgonamonadaceae bacterium]|jgi:phosphate transport system substrate-binding protein|nr:phosphate ABC transporter substrate-binding protein PstS [Dysgonamonadaceae bacterium]